MYCAKRPVPLQCGRAPDGFILVVENIPRDHNEVGLHIVYRLHSLLDISRLRAVSQMQVSQQRNRHIFSRALDRNRIVGHAQPVGIGHAVQAHCTHQHQRNAAPAPDARAASAGNPFCGCAARQTAALPPPGRPAPDTASSQASSCRPASVRAAATVAPVPQSRSAGDRAAKA